MTTQRLPVTAILGLCLFLIGMAAAAVAPYRAIVAVDNLHISNSLFALITTLSSVGMALGSLVLGYFADRMADRRRLVMVSALLGTLAYGLLALFPTKLTYILAFCVILPLSGSLFSQTFSFARAFYNLRQPQRAEFMTSVLRTLFSASWVVVPPLAGWLASRYTAFAVFPAAALSYLVFAISFGLLFLSPDSKIGTPRKSAEAGAAGWRIPLPRLVGISGVTLVRVAIALHTMTLPLALVKDFGGTLKDVGINASLAAGLEVPWMLAWGWAASRLPKETILWVNALLYALYLGLVFHAHSVQQVLWLQALNAIPTAALLSITISYMQEAIKGRIGLSTALMDATSVIATFLASAAFAALASHEQYTPIFMAASGVSLLGAGALALSRFLPSAQE